MTDIEIKGRGKRILIVEDPGDVVATQRPEGGWKFEVDVVVANEINRRKSDGADEVVMFAGAVGRLLYRGEKRNLPEVGMRVPLKGNTFVGNED